MGWLHGLFAAFPALWLDVKVLCDSLMCLIVSNGGQINMDLKDMGEGQQAAARIFKLVGE